MTTLAERRRERARARATRPRSRRPRRSSPGRSSAAWARSAATCASTRAATYYNQTYFWREGARLLPEEGRHALPRRAGGRSASPPRSNDSGAGADGARRRARDRRARRPAQRVAIDEFFVADGIHNKVLEPGEILVEVRVPPTRARPPRRLREAARRAARSTSRCSASPRALDLDGAGRGRARRSRAHRARRAPAARQRARAELLRGTRPGAPAFDEAVEAPRRRAQAVPPARQHPRRPRLPPRDGPGLRAPHAARRGRTAPGPCTTSEPAERFAMS